MRCEKFKHIQKIRQTYLGDSELSKTNQMSLIKMLAEDLNKTDTHFIFELIQNAEDNAYAESLPYISFQLTKMDPTSTEGSDGALIVENNEVGFNGDNVRAICATGQSTKKKAQKKYIGEKGIGFKSVFRMTGNPHIFSNGYHFCLPEYDEETELGYVVPRWIDSPPEGLNPSATHIILPLTKPDFGYTQIEKMIADIQPEVILFLSTLKQIRVKTDTGIDFTILKDNERQPEVTIHVKSNKVGSYKGGDFLVCTKTFDKPADIDHEKREGVEDREVSIAFPLAENSTAMEKIFAYLPVRDNTGLPFLINADFILTSSRNDIHEDTPWNCWLMKCVADLVVEEFLPLLKEWEHLSIDFLEALASELNNLADNENDLFYPIFSRLREAFMNEELLPANDGTFVSAQNARLADSEGLIKLLNPDQLSLLLKRSDVTKWLLSNITERRTPNLWSYLTKELKVDAVDPRMFASRIDTHFLKQQSDDWFVSFYKYLFAGERPPRFLWDSPSRILQSKPILRLQDDSLINPDAPNVYLSKGTDSETTSRLIKSEISQNEEAHKFLKELGVPEWDIVAEVIEHILLKYRNNQSTIPRAEYDRDFAKIVNAYKTDSEKKKNQLREALMATPFIFVERSDRNEQIFPRPNQLYFGTDNGLWRNNYNGTHSRVSASKQIYGFLRTLEIPQWDAVDEVIKTILPKYNQNPPRVPIKEHMSDFKKITLAYETSEPSRKKQLQTELQTTHFILVEKPKEVFPIYLKPNRLYFGTDALRMYFDGNDLVSWFECYSNNGLDLVELWEEFAFDSFALEGPTTGAFVSLNKYPDSARALFEDLGVRDSVHIERRKKNSREHVIVHCQYGFHQRGLKGFDPDIQVDGLVHAIDNPTPEKSAFIWNEIARPNIDCVRGTIEKAKNQHYTDSEPMEEISNSFGRLLIDTAWLPDSDGNMHKPSEITLAELPESFERDRQLADQLDMKKGVVAELAKETGIPIEVIEQIKQNPEEYAEFQEWKAAKKTHEKKEKEGPEQSSEKNNVPYDGTPADAGSTPPRQTTETTGGEVCEMTEIEQDLQDDESLKQDLEKLRNQRYTIKRNRILGKRVEGIVGQILREKYPKEEFDVNSVHEGADFEISVTHGNQTWWIEVKSTRTEGNSQGVIISSPQVKKAVKKKDKFLICVVPIPENIELNLDTVKKNMYFITNIGERVVTLWGGIKQFDAVRTKITSDISSDVKDVKVVVDGGKAGILVRKSVWEEDGLRLAKLAEHLIPTNDSNVI